MCAHILNNLNEYDANQKKKCNVTLSDKATSVFFCLLAKAVSVMVFMADAQHIQKVVVFSIAFLTECHLWQGTNQATN